MEAFLNNLYVSFENMTYGTMLCYGGIAGAVFSFILLLLCIAIFPVKRRRLLKKLAEEE